MARREDIRMRGFRDRSTVEEALDAALAGISPLPSECVDVMAAAGRVLADDVVSDVNVPAFRRSMMDGYAVRAEDTYGATAYNPIPLEVAGSSMPGTVPGDQVQQRQCVMIVTGAPMPEGADAVLMVENTSRSGDLVEATAPVPVGRNVGRIGEDVAAGELIL
ncbi:MAG: molybdopterin molybdenumtransferase MoeA, partial [Actinomycetota bacterium]|nr:molybdopterin molybdenumtransferase MoeA [Actinomycetota bacterium]